MPGKDELVREMKQYIPCPVMINQLGMERNNTQRGQLGWTSEACSGEGNEKIQTMHSNAKPVKYEVKQYEPCTVRMD